MWRLFGVHFPREVHCVASVCPRTSTTIVAPLLRSHVSLKVKIHGNSHLSHGSYGISMGMGMDMGINKPFTWEWTWDRNDISGMGTNGNIIVS